MASVAAIEGGRRDGAVIALAGLAHYTSHLMQLALPPLFPLLHAKFGASYTQLGLLMTLFYAASGLGQAAAGVLVDRFGALRILVAGLVAISLGTALSGLIAAYWMLLPLALLAGFGNAVFHPADLSILSHRVSEGRLGRAFAAHGLSGQLGFATAPAVITALAALGSWRLALLAFGVFGLGVAALVFVNRPLLDYDRHSGAQIARHSKYSYLDVIGSPLVIMAFGYFVLTAFGGTGIQTFGITAWTTGYGLTLEMATLGLTIYIIGNASGMALGGFLADRTERHHRVAMAGMAASAGFVLLVLAIGSVPLLMAAAMALAGIANGVTAPSRDVLIRRAATGAGMGSVFGFVYSGFDLGSSAAPLLFGWIIDHHAPHAIFVVVAISFALAAPTVMQVGLRSRRLMGATSAAD
jgi:MFS family permease